RNDADHIHEYAGVLGCFEDHDLTVLKFRAPDGMRPAGFWIADVARPIIDVTFERDPYALFANATFQFEDGTEESVTIDQRLAGLWQANGASGAVPKLAIFDEWMTLRTSAGEVAPGVAEQGMVRQVV